jgi:protein involved in polysaccharide export with SLBB domain
VKKPGTVNLAGPLTVLQAISQAEGFTEAARVSDVIVIRRGSKNEPTSLVVDLKKAMSGSDPNQDMQLKPYDIVYVPRSRIANVKGFFQNVIRSALPW